MNEKLDKRTSPGRGRPGGNPDFGKKIKFESAHDEPNSAQLFLRIRPSLLTKIKSLDNWQDLLREKLDELFDE